MGLCRMEKGHTYTLEEFRQAQHQQLQEVRPTALGAFQHSLVHRREPVFFEGCVCLHASVCVSAWVSVIWPRCLLAGVRSSEGVQGAGEGGGEERLPHCSHEAGFIPDYGSYDPEFPGTRTVQVLGSMAPGYCGLYRRFKSFTQTEFVQSDYSV